MASDNSYISNKKYTYDEVTEILSDKIIENNHGRIFTYIASSASEIMPEKLVEYLKLARKIEVDEYKKLLNQWDEFNQMNPSKKIKFDAIVANPPFSLRWEPTEAMADDFRFKSYGLAPKSKADYAFLLHELYHLKPDGIMTIVLPHGVLFRGGEEGQIRKNLIENHHIQAIIGLPANIFFGTGIPTIVMVLRKKRDDDRVLIVDSSKHFIKDGKNNKLQASDIKRIVDVVSNNRTVPKFSRLVSIDEIRANDYNLNISRYVDTFKDDDSIDLKAVHAERQHIKAELALLEERMAGYLKALGHD